MNRYIKKLIEKGENQQLDFKFQITDSKKIARTLVAFANTDGGKLLIGVKDNGRIAGIRSEEEFYMIESAARMYSKPEVLFDTKKHNIDGKAILEIDVLMSSKRPHMAPDKNDKWKAYVRVADQNLLANKIQILVWRKQKNQEKGAFFKYTDAEKQLFDYLTSHDTITFSRFLKLAEISRYKAETILVNFILMDILKIVFTEKHTLYKLNDNLEFDPNQLYS